MQRYSILWADDEIDLLKPHILFLEQRGYDITPVNNASDAVELSDEKHFDVVFLDEHMPGMSGLEALSIIKTNKPNLPVVMITKNEEEHIMEEAIGSKIADYLIKPLNPSQILLSVKKILDNKRLVIEKTNLNYQQEFRKISMAFMDDMNHEQWADIYKKLIHWELQMDQPDNQEMGDVLDMQKTEANANFSRFITRNYESWLNNPSADKPLLSHQLMKKKVFPELGGKPLFFVLIDNLRIDQWKVIEPIISEYFNIEKEENYYSILPTTTAYARNAIFSGQLPSEMAKTHPDLWVGEDEEEGKNNFEDEFLAKQLRRNNLNVKMSYHKIKNMEEGRSLADTVNNLFKNDLNVIVYNFVDMLSHARTDMAMIRELAPDESAYRSITRSWFLHSPLFDILKKISEKDVKVVITTDHGTIRVKRAFKIIGDRSVNTNLRYKQGKNLGFDGDKVMHVTRPEKLFLPKPNVSTSYVFATEDQFFAYPNNFNYYVNFYNDTFQHGGISLEEMIIPIIFLTSKNVS
ncbi:T9SS response regulator signal transducer PorX [Ohtaekwangia koreensis]|jgi:CheY-like chemotaxis protein|uniref:Response regulator receiver domain-containing protein n=1 Tax=Ohtaekwangia koreensis TaxID=688867 RepID=A0A1T5MEI2_9BACT|nr:bifunctional response regulator/alkaline phosphatase family protein [Ohtaekwangia koreensis]SKC86493.1 Response regulator receiver domain-containing protein [Ohtaekwangia koreensis]